MAVKKRCGFCLRVVRADGTCRNEECPRYVPDPEPTEPTETPATSESVTDTNGGGNTETEPTP